MSETQLDLKKVWDIANITIDKLLQVNLAPRLSQLDSIKEEN